jgi:hypothetical protein
VAGVRRIGATTLRELPTERSATALSHGAEQAEDIRIRRRKFNQPCRVKEVLLTQIVPRHVSC